MKPEVLKSWSLEIDYSRACLGADQKARGLWERDWSKLVEIFSDLIIELICKDARESNWYGIIIDETSVISRYEQVSFCFSYTANGCKKEEFVGFHATETTDGETLYKLVKEVINKLQLGLENIVGECFDGAINMSGVNKGLSARMKECSPLAIMICALLWSLVKFGTARHHDNSGIIAKYSRHNPDSVQFSRG